MAIVSYEFNELPKIKPADLERIDSIRDEDIDYSEMRKLTDRDWERAMTHAQFMAYIKAKKQQS